MVEGREGGREGGEEGERRSRQGVLTSSCQDWERSSELDCHCQEPVASLSPATTTTTTTTVNEYHTQQVTYSLATGGETVNKTGFRS